MLPVVVMVVVWVLASTGASAQFSLVSVKEEIELGQQVDAQVRREMPQLRDAAVTAYVRVLGRRLVPHAPGPKYP